MDKTIMGIDIGSTTVKIAVLEKRFTWHMSGTTPIWLIPL